MKRSMALLAGMVFFGALSLAPDLGFSGVLGQPPAFIGGLGAFLGLMSVGLGAVALRHRRAGFQGQIRWQLLAVVAAAVLAGIAVTFVPPVSSAYQRILGTIAHRALFGGISARCLAALAPLSWLFLFAAGVPRRRARLALGAAGIVVVVLLVVWLPRGFQRGTQRIASTIWPSAERTAGQPVPDLRLSDVNGHDVSLSDFKGKILLINVWRTW